MKTKYNLQDMQEIAISRGGACLSNRYFNIVTKLKWKCKEGHEWYAQPADVKNKGTWCRKCADKVRGDGRRLTIEEMRNIAHERGGECLSTKYVDATVKLQWRCGKGHVWKAMPMNVKYGKSWCRTCATIERAKSQTLTLEDMQRMAKDRGGKCLSKEYVNVMTNLKWKCNKGHIWEAMPHNIHSGWWCPHCSGHARCTIQQMKKIAKKRHGKCLSNRYVNSRTKLKWKCEKGHIWIALPPNIKKGGWCPICFGRKIESL